MRSTAGHTLPKTAHKLLSLGLKSIYVTQISYNKKQLVKCLRSSKNADKSTDYGQTKAIKNQHAGFVCQIKRFLFVIYCPLFYCLTVSSHLVLGPDSSGKPHYTSDEYLESRVLKQFGD